MATSSRARPRPAQRKPAAAPARGHDVGALVSAGTAALVAVVFWRTPYDTFGSIKLTLLLLGGLTAAGVIGWQVIDDRRLAVPRTTLLLVGAFLAVATLTTVLSTSPLQSLVGDYRRFAGLGAYAACVVLFLLLVRAGAARSFAVLAYTLGVATALVVLYGLVQLADADPFKWVDIGLNPRISTLGQPNLLAAYLGIALPVLVWIAVSAKIPTLVRAAAGAVAIAGLALVPATSSFQGIVALVAGAAVLAVGYGSTYLGSRHRRTALGALAAVAVLVAALPTRGWIIRQVDEGMNERRLLWRAAMTMIGDRPLLGDGFGTYARQFSTVRPAEHTVFGFLPADAPPDVPLAMFVSGGVLLGLAYLAFVGYTGYRLVVGLRRSSGQDRLLLSAFGGAWLAYQAQSLVSFDVPATMVLHFVTAAVVIRLSLSADGHLEGPAAGPRRRAATAGQQAGRVALVVLLLAAGWFALRPLRADLAAGRAARAAVDNDPQAEVEAAREATALASWEGIYWGLDAAAEVKIGEVGLAMLSGERASTRTPSNVRYALSTASLAEQIGDEDRATRWYRFAAEHDPRNLEPVAAAVTHLLARDRPADAVELAEDFVEVQPASGRGWLLLARAQAAADDRRSALASVERALDVAPELAEADAFRTELRAAG